jgi:hypothetical protein
MGPAWRKMKKRLIVNINDKQACLAAYKIIGCLYIIRQTGPTTNLLMSFLLQKFVIGSETTLPAAYPALW